MADILNNFKKTVLIASDIFGLSEAFLALLKESEIAEHVMVVSPYQQHKTHFETEQQAYQCFQNRGGIEAYILSLTEALSTHTDIKQVVGFSAGGAALYKAISNLADHHIKLTLFYPGQIRYFLDKHPNSPCHIIFPEIEPNFSLPEVIKVLAQQPHLKVEQNNYQHGFMNKDSKAFNQTAYNYYSQLLKQLLVHQ